MKKYWVELKWMATMARSYWLDIGLLVVFSALMSLTGVAFALASRKLIDTAMVTASAPVKQGNMFFENSSLWHAGIALGLIIVIQISVQVLFGLINTRTLEKMGNSLRNVMFKKLLKSDWAAFSTYHSGDVVTRMTSDASTVTSGMTWLVPELVAMFVQLIAAFVVLYSFDRVLALLAFMLGPILVLFSRLFTQKLRALHIKCQEGESKTRSFMQEALQNLLTVKAFNLENQYTEHMEELQKDRMSWVMKRSWTGVASGAGLSLGFWMGYFLALAWGSYRLSTGMITFGTMTVFLQLIGQIQGPFLGLARSLSRIISTLASAGRLIELDKLPVEKEGIEDNSCVNSENDYCVEVEALNFGYKKDVLVLEKVSLKVLPGEIVAIRGPSGEGKTTLIKLLLAFAMPDSGLVAIGDSSGAQQYISASTRKYFSYVPQGNTVFSGTIEENLRVGDAGASLEELEACAKMACAWEFIAELPQGLSTKIGEHGLGLSEGQAQRIAIARALLRKAPILLLDEATSALDSHTEEVLLKAIKGDKLKRTCIIITHRHEVLEFCDRVFRIEGKKVYEESKNGHGDRCLDRKVLQADY